MVTNATGLVKCTLVPGIDNENPDMRLALATINAVSHFLGCFASARSWGRYEEVRRMEPCLYIRYMSYLRYLCNLTRRTGIVAARLRAGCMTL